MPTRKTKPGLLERVELQGQVLLAGGDAGVGDALTAAAVVPLSGGGRRVRLVYDHLDLHPLDGVPREDTGGELAA